MTVYSRVRERQFNDLPIDLPRRISELYFFRYVCSVSVTKATEGVIFITGWKIADCVRMK